MTSDYDRIRALFDELVDLPAEQREPRIAETTDLDDASRHRLRRLLDADDAANELTARRAFAHDGRRAAERGAGQRIGAYVVEGEVGRGGMGNVYRAHRADGHVDQTVAIKVVRPERIDASTLARFRLERQVLAVLKHPNIATMLDAGELGEGVPYVVMEYVEGEPITEYANAKSLDLKQRLGLFLAVCDAVAYAHNSLIVHRDLKPSNILVAADGRPKLLDFGIAKPLLAQLGAFDVEETGTAQRFFSPYNVAPEQLRGEPTTVACDVYGLGVVLYELVAGARPFDFDGRTPSQVEATIFDAEPARPSRRASLASVPSRLLVGDIDAIVLRCLRKAPGDRYRTVEDLARDVANYLADRPVTARDGNLTYRVGRFVSRNRRTLATTVLLIAVSGAGLYAYFDQQRETAGQRMRADRVTALIIDSLKSIDPREMKGYDISAREVFAGVERQVVANTELDPGVRAEILSTIATIDVRLGLYKQGLDVLDKIDVQKASVTTVEEIQQQRARAMIGLADYDGASALVAQRATRPTSGAARVEWALIDADIDSSQARYEQTVKKLEAIDRTGLNQDMDDAVRTQLASALNGYGEYARAEAAYKSLLADQRRRLPKNHPDLMATISNYADLYMNMGRNDEAFVLGKEAAAIAEDLYGRRSLQYIRMTWVEENVRAEKGDVEGALKIREERIKSIEEMFGPQSRRLLGSYLMSAQYNYDLGRMEACDAQFRKVIDLGERVLSPDNQNLLIYRTAYADNLTNRGLYAQARAVARPGLEAVEKFAALQELSVASILRFIDALSAYASAPTPANADAARHWLASAKLEMTSGSAKRSMEKLIPIAAKLGIETP